MTRGSRPDGSTPSGRGRGRKVLIGSAAVLTAVLAAGGAYFVFEFEPQRFDPVVITSHPPKVSINDPAAPAPADADLEKASKDVTAEISPSFVLDLDSARSTWAKKEAKNVVTESDPCLLDWAHSNLGQLASTGTYAVMDVCGRPTAVLAGAAGADSKVFVFSALQPEAPEGMRELLVEDGGNRMAFSAVRTADGEAQLLAAAVLPSVPKTKADPEPNTDPPIVNIRPKDVPISGG